MVGAHASGLIAEDDADGRFLLNATDASYVPKSCRSWMRLGMRRTTLPSAAATAVAVVTAAPC